MIIFLFFLVLLAVIWWLLHMWFHRRFLRLRYKQPSQEVQSRMLQCHYCGLYVPQTEVVVVANRTYCSLAHAEMRK